MGVVQLYKNKTKIIHGLTILAAWIIFGQVALRRTMSDKKAKREFSRIGLLLLTEILQIEDRNLHYVSTGSANFPIIIFLHGSPRSWTYFKDYIGDKDLLRQYRLVSIDRPGYGQSDFGKGLHVHEQTQLICALLDKLDHQQPIYLVGHSMGAPLAVALAAVRSALVSKIVVLAGALSPYEEKKRNWRKMFINTPFRYLLPGAWRPSNDESYYLKQDLELLSRKFDKVKCPVYLVHGTKDRVVSVRNTEWASKMFIHSPAVKVILLKNAGHNIPLKDYDKIKALLQQLKEEDAYSSSFASE